MKTVRESYVKRLRDNYLLILRTLMHDLILSIDKDGNFVFVNDAAVEFFGKPRKRLIGTHFSDYVHPDDLEKALVALQSVIEKKGQVKGFILRGKSPSGYRTLAWNGLAIFDEAGDYVGVQATGKDLSDLLRAEEELRASEERFKYFIENAPDAIWVQDLSGTFIDGNKMAEKIIGYKRDELIGQNILELNLIPPKYAPAVMQAFETNSRGEMSGPTELELIRKDGSTIFIEASSIPVEHYGKTEVIGIARDISDRKAVEQQLKESEERYRMQIEEALDAIFLIDANTGIIVDCNRAATTLVDRTKPELIGKNPQILHPPDANDKIGSAFRKNVKENKGEILEAPIITSTGKIRTAAIKANIIELGDKKVVQAVFRDITSQKKAEDALRDSEKRFRDLSELLPEIVFETDIEGNLTFANKVAYDKSGYSREDFAEGLRAFQLLVPNDRTRAMTNMVKVLNGTELGFVEYTSLRKDGTRFPILIHTTPIVRENKLLGLRGVIIDITERKKSEDALKKSEARFRSTLDSMLEGCQIIGYDWRYLYVNDAAAKHGRLNKKDLLGKTLMETYPKIEDTPLFEVLSKCMQDRVPAQLENEFEYPDGKKAWFELSIEPVPEGLFMLSIDITDRKEVQEALRREREILEMVTGNINAGLVVVSKDFTILWANEVLKQYLGEIEGKPCYSVLNQKEDICHGCGVQEVFESGKDWVVHEQVIPTPSGQDVWLEITATAIRDKTGEIVAASEMSWDITERKKTELKLKESLQKFRTVFEGATDGIVAINPETQKCVFANPRMSEITGYPYDELRDLNLFSLLRDDDLAFGKEQFAKMLEGKVAVTRNVPILRKDKRLVYCDVSSKLMKIGNQVYLVGFLRDVTEQKIAEDKLRESEQRFKHFLFNAPEAIWVQDFSGTFIDGNKMAEELTGYTREEMLGKNMLEMGLVSPEYISKVMEAFQPVSVGERSGPTELLLQRKDGRTVIVEASIIPVEREGNIEIIGVVLDVTERKKAQEAITSANHLLKQSNEELESYTYVVSHDLKAPLRTILSFGSFLLEDYEDKLDETGKDYLNRMVNASSHLDSMIEDLLVLSRVGRKFTEFENVNLNKLFDEILFDLETSIKESNAKVVVGKLPVIYLQRVWIKQVFMNLLSNALKFNESKIPKIEVRYEERETDHLFTVKDNGIGVEEKYLSRIFNLFERAPTEKKYEGTGAGLAICKKIIEKFGGQIWVESTLGKGSSFYFTIPKDLKQAKEE